MPPASDAPRLASIAPAADLTTFAPAEYDTTTPPDTAPGGRALAVSGVPTALSSFVGRGRDLDEVSGLLHHARLLTLSGAGGVGKTRLAREVATRVAADAVEGPAVDDAAADAPPETWWVELAPLPPGADVAPAVAGALGVRQPPGAGADDALAAALGTRRLLLVLDNCEHVVDACARLADRLLRSCPGLTLLATSREALGVEGEVVWPVAGLAHPPARTVARGDGPPSGDAAALAEYDAVRLFVARARAVQPGFTLTARNAAAVAAITARLDGLPLALELAAAQVAALGVDALATRLDDVFAVLARGRRTALPRHKTLRALLDWSYHLLDEPERTLLRRLSVFRDAFTLEQAEAVCGEPPAGAEADVDGGASSDGEALGAASVFTALGRLAEQSLVAVQEESGEARYRLLETVRQYGATLLRGTPDEARTRARHAGWAAAFVAQVGPRLWSVERRQAGAEVAAVYEDVRSALTWAATAAMAPGPDAMRQTRAGEALGIAGGLTWFYLSTGRWEDGRRAYATALGAAAAVGLVTAAGDAAHDLAGHTVALRRALAETHYLGAVGAWLDSDYPEAVMRSERATGGWAALAADTRLRDAERRSAAIGLAFALEMEAQAHGMMGDLARALTIVDRAVGAAERSGDARHLAALRVRRAFVRVAAGDGAGAEADFAAAVATYQRIGERWLRSLAYQGMAVHALVLGDVGAAVARARVSVELVRGEDDPWFLTRSVDTLAAALVAVPRGSAVAPDRAAAAATLLAGAAAVRQRAGLRISAYDRDSQEGAVDTARAALGAAAFEAAWQAGAGLGEAELFARAADAATLVPTDEARALDVLVPAPPANASAAVCAVASWAAPGTASPSAAPLGAGPASATRPGARPSGPALQLLAFGPLAVVRGGVALGSGELTPAKARELLLYLILHPPRTKDQIALALWPDVSEARVRNAFHVTLHHLRRILGGKDAVAFDGSAYRLARPTPGTPAADAFDCDVDAVLAAAEAARRADREAERIGARGDALAAVLDTAAPGAGRGVLAAWRAALDRVGRGPLGEGADAGDWLVGHQDRVRAAWGDGMEALARLHARHGAPPAAADVLETLVAADPLREAAHRALMACYAAAGEPARALAHYETLVELVAREVGTTPARETRALAEAIRQGA